MLGRMVWKSVEKSNAKCGKIPHFALGWGEYELVIFDRELRGFYILNNMLFIVLQLGFDYEPIYTKERSVSYYADRLCVTPKYLSQVIHKVSGRFAGDWITDFVILEAKALLKSRKYTIQQVSDKLNFANQSFFGKYFKENVGCSPSKYQNE